MSNKLLAFQKKVGAISKDSTNPYFKSKYFDINKLIEEIKPILNELGLVLLQPLENINGKPALRTIIYDVNRDGFFPIVDFAITIPENPDPQKMGSIITYYRRCAIQSLLFLQAEDDDGNSAMQAPPKIDKQPAKEIKTYQNKAHSLGQKELVAHLLKEAMPKIKTAEDYKEACMNLTGFELLPANYETIINLLK